MRTIVMTFLTSSSDCPSCGSQHKGKPFCVYENGAHCFSCGYTKSYDHSYTMARDVQIHRTSFPDACFDPAQFSITNLKWLAKYHVDAATIKKYLIAETRNGGLILPYFKDGQLMCYQTRWNVEPRLIVSRGSKIPALFTILESRTLVIVEDFISAIRLADHVHAVCLWGTKAPYLYLKMWFKQYDNILVCLDNDKDKKTNSGQEAAKKICNTLNSILQSNNKRYGFGQSDDKTIKLVVTDCDPKCYSPSELKQLIGATHASPAK